MTCDRAREELPLMLFGDLSFDAEEALEKHLAECRECRSELGRHRAIHGLLLEDAAEPSTPLLAECRRDLSLSLQAREAARRPLWRSWFAWTWKPVLAAGRVAAGYFGARLTQGQGETAIARVRNIETGPAGRIHIVFDETRSRSLRGQLGDEPIQRALLAAARDESDPGLRAETIEILKGSTYSDEVRGALLHSLRHDTDPAVRLKALESLKPYAAQPEVRKALAQVLTADTNPVMRSQAIDLLTTSKVPSDVVTALQMLMRQEQDGSIRSRGERLLQAMKASTETF